MKQFDRMSSRGEPFVHQDTDGCVSHEGEYVETFGQRPEQDGPFLSGTHLHAPPADENKPSPTLGSEPPAPLMESLSDRTRPAIRLNARTAREGIIMAELLGAPVSRRRRRF